MQIGCPYCGDVIQLSEESKGLRIACGTCGNAFLAPTPSDFDRFSSETQTRKNREGSASTDTEGHAARSVSPPVLVSSSPPGTRELLPQAFGVVGSAFLVVGVFLPVFSLPVVGNVNYIYKGRADGIIILTLLSASGILHVANRYRPLWYTGLGTLAVLAFTFTRFKLRLSELREAVLAELPDNPIPELGHETLDKLQLQWGWAVLVLGAIFVVS